MVPEENKLTFFLLQLESQKRLETDKETQSSALKSTSIMICDFQGLCKEIFFCSVCPILLIMMKRRWIEGEATRATRKVQYCNFIILHMSLVYCVVLDIEEFLSLQSSEGQLHTRVEGRATLS